MSGGSRDTRKHGSRGLRFFHLGGNVATRMPTFWVGRQLSDDLCKAPPVKSVRADPDMLRIHFQCLLYMLNWT